MTYQELTFASQGLELGGHLYLPDNQARIGAVCITGGMATAGELFSEWQEYMAEHGIASLSFDARGKGESQGYWSTRDPERKSGDAVNSQLSRVLDTLKAITELNYRLPTGTDMALVGASMGGDVAIHAASILAQSHRQIKLPAALVLKAPPAYHKIVHDAAYGEEFTAVSTDHDAYPPIESKNFDILRSLNIPTQLLVSRGEQIILPDINECYKRVVGEELLNGEVIELGDETTRHAYFTADDEVSRRAKQETIELSTAFLLKQVA